MTAAERVREYLEERRCPEHVVAGGLDGLLAAWEVTVAQLEAGYPLGLEDYLNDMDGRELLEGALAVAQDPDAWGRAADADARARAQLVATRGCLWGDEEAALEGWTAERNWWYFGRPRHAGATLLADLATDAD